MRTIFIVNPAAGKRERPLRLLPEIQAYFSARPEAGSYKCRVTSAPGEARDIARAEAEAGGEVRIIACGGDGTLMEAAEGLQAGGRSYSGAALGCIPCGSANDFVRCFPGLDFRHLDALMRGEVRKVDAIRCGDRLALNLCSMGMDAEVAAKKDRYKHLPLVSGPLAYQMARVDVFCHRIGKELRVVMDAPAGPVEESGRYFFALAASGQYYGGGYRGAPEAEPDDGLLDFILIKAMPRIRVPGFLKRYKQGGHLDMEGCSRYRGTRMRVFCDGEAAVNLDGECHTAREAAFEVLPGAIPFLFPAPGKADGHL